MNPGSPVPEVVYSDTSKECKEIAIVRNKLYFGVGIQPESLPNSSILQLDLGDLTMVSWVADNL